MNDLPHWRPEWTKRLLGLVPFEPPVRTIEKVESEYNQDKWSRAGQMFDDSDRTLSSMRIREIMTDSKPEADRACVIDSNLAVSTCVQQYEILLDLFENWFADSISQSETVIELGTAFGTFVTELEKRFDGPMFCGADYSANGVALAERLNEGNPKTHFQRFDFYQPEYDILANAKGPCTVFTAQAIEQLPSAEPFVKAILANREKVHSVFHLEPAYEVQDDTLLGLMRKRYLDMNDYCRDLMSQLRRREAAGEIEIKRVEPDVFGFNPFNCLTLIEWRPV